MTNTAAPRIAIVTAAAARDFDEDLAPLLDAFSGEIAEVSACNWDDVGVDWSSFDIALLRSPWDYTQRVHEFLDWAKRTAQATTLLNPLDVITWNTDKHYLRDLAKAGVNVVPSQFVEPGADAARAIETFIASTRADNQSASCSEFVVKPAIGAGSRDAQRYGFSDRDAAGAHAQQLLDARRSVLLQPYLDRVDEHGETALIFFEGQFSHAIRKGALLHRGQGPTRALFATEHIQPRAPSEQHRQMANRALAAMHFDQPLLYARVDLIDDPNGAPCVLELELTEPSLFFAHAPDSARWFARAVLARATAPNQRK